MDEIASEITTELSANYMRGFDLAFRVGCKILRPVLPLLHSTDEAYLRRFPPAFGLLPHERLTVHEA